MNFDQLLVHLNEEEIAVSPQQLQLLKDLMSSTLSANERFNLTAIKDEESFVEKMIFDSALGIKDLDLENKNVIDVGTGAGFPGMVIRILCPTAKVTLLDSTKKKTDHLKEFAKEHNLTINGISDRAEDYARKNTEQFDYAYARAVSGLSVLLEIIVPMLKVGGHLIALKGPGYEQEINDAKNAFKKLNCHIESIYETELPECKERRAILRIVKDKETNKKYPRQFNEIKKLPL